MAFASICEHASSPFIFESTSSDQFSHASSEHFRNYKSRAASTLYIFRELEFLHPASRAFSDGTYALYICFFRCKDKAKGDKVALLAGWNLSFIIKTLFYAK